MKNAILSFVCGLAIGAAAASGVWFLSGSAGTTKPSAAPVVAAPKAIPPEPAAEAVAAATEPETPASPEVSAPEVAEVGAEAETPPSEPRPRQGRGGPRPPQAGSAPESDGDRPAVAGPPRWENMSEEERQEIRQRFRRMHDERLTGVVNTFVEKNGLAEDGGAALYDVVDGMNERILSRLQLWVDYLDSRNQQRIQPDQGAQLLRDLLDEVVQGYEDIDTAYGKGWRETSPELDLGELIDPEAFGNLMRLGGFGRGPGGGPPRSPRGGPPPNAQ